MKWIDSTSTRSMHTYHQQSQNPVAARLLYPSKERKAKQSTERIYKICQSYSQPCISTLTSRTPPKRQQLKTHIYRYRQPSSKMHLCSALLYSALLCAPSSNGGYHQKYTLLLSPSNRISSHCSTLERRDSNSDDLRVAVRDADRGILDASLSSGSLGVAVELQQRY